MFRGLLFSLRAQFRFYGTIWRDGIFKLTPLYRVAGAAEPPGAGPPAGFGRVGDQRYRPTASRKGRLTRNKALLFEQVPGYSMPVVANLFGHPERMAWALGRDSLEQLRTDLADLIDLRFPQGLGPAISRGRELLNALQSLGLKPHLVKKAPVQEVQWQGDEVDLGPLADSHLLAQGRRPLCHFAGRHHPRPHNSGTRNVGMYRLQVYDRQTLGMHWQLHKGGAEHQEHVPAGERIPVAVSLGGDPAVIWSASAPLPPGIDEFLLASWLRGKPVELVRCLTQPLEGTGRGRNRHRGVRRSGRAPAGGPLWRPHRLLHPGGGLSGAPRHRHHSPRRRHLSGDGGRAAADGRLLDGQGHRAALFTPHATIRRRDCRLAHAGRRRLSQPCCWSVSANATPARRARS